jgi:hypothetical protein
VGKRFGHKKIELKMIGTNEIEIKRGIQWDRYQIGGRERGRATKKIGLKLIGTIAIKMKRGI